MCVCVNIRASFSLNQIASHPAIILIASADPNEGRAEDLVCCLHLGRLQIINEKYLSSLKMAVKRTQDHVVQTINSLNFRFLQLLNRVDWKLQKKL